MKNLLCLSIILCLCSCMPKDLPTYVQIGQDAALIKLSHKSTKTEMEKIEADLKTVGISFDYSKSIFFDDGKLRDLNIFVTCPNGQGGRTAAMLTNIQFSYYGFKYDKNGAVPFQIGSI